MQNSERQNSDVIHFSRSSETTDAAARFQEAVLKAKRPTPPTGSLDDDICVFVLDVDYTMAAPPVERHILRDRSPSHFLSNTQVPVLNVFGVTSEGWSTLLRIHGVFPYAYVPCPQGTGATLDCAKVMEKLDVLMGSAPGARGFEKKILAVEVVKRTSLMNYKASSDFLKITCAFPKCIATLRALVEAGIALPDGTTLPQQAFEAKIPFALRFMVDNGIAGCSWITVPKGKFVQRHASSRVSRCALEIETNVQDIHAEATDDPKWMHIAPIRTLSFDIECVTLSGTGFPSPDKDPIIQIGCFVTDLGHPDKSWKVMFSLKTCAAIAGALVVSFDDEADMLLRWREFLVSVDPDVLTGYNVINFDLNYIIIRSQAIDARDARQLSRLVGSESRIRDAVLSSRAMGTHENKDINIEGRIQLDVLDAVRREYKLKSYSLNAVSAHFLKEQKEDVHYSMMADLYNGNDESRKRIAVYCLKDAYLPMRLIESLLILYNLVEMARVTGVPVALLLTRGQQIKVTSQLLRKCKALDFIVPTAESRGGEEDKYEGATVLEPMKGFYPRPIATLDFASLYPSIMMAHNLCYCTLLSATASASMTPENFVKSPAGFNFVKPTLRRGILPMIVEELIEARKRAKKQMAETKDEMTRMVLNGRQLALKISANSVYGYTGAAAGGQLPCLEISTSITAYGRDMIDFTRDMVTDIYSSDKGYAKPATVIYGDTDSVMVDFHVQSIGEAMNLGREAAAKISAMFPSPIKLEFEKVFSPFLLMNKKRYAGLLWTQEEKFDKIDCKGIETVRRDFCLLVQQLVDRVLNRILIDSDVEGAKSMTRDIIADLLQNKVDLSLLVVSKTLAKEDYAAKQGHVELAAKLKKRDAGTAPTVGDRVHYVIIKGSKGQPQYERCEDPLYVLENNLSIDTDYYLDHIKKPLMRIFEGVMTDPAALFTGEHTLAKKVMHSTAGAMSKFVKVSRRCLACRAAIKKGALCDHCKETKERKVVVEKSIEVSEKQKEFNELWVQCQRCQGSLHQDILCTSRDCPIFYRRMKVQKEIIQLEDDVRTLDTEW